MSRSSIVDAEVSKLRALSLGGLDAFQKRDRRSPSISQISADSAVGLVGGDIDRTAAESTPLSSLTKKHIGLLLLLKTFANAALRFQYPFAPFLADSLGVSSAQYFNALAAGDAMGMLGIVIGPIADRYPPRAFVVASALLLTIGLSFAAAFRNYSVFFVSWVVVGVGYYGLAAALQVRSPGWPLAPHFVNCGLLLLSYCRPRSLAACPRQDLEKSLASSRPLTPSRLSVAFLSWDWF